MASNSTFRCKIWSSPQASLAVLLLQSLAWKIADLLAWPDTFAADYIALTQLHADALVCMDSALARAIDNTAIAVSTDDLLGSA